MSDRMTVEQWHEQLRKGIINVDIRHILWDWQGDRVELIADADRRKKLLRRCQKEIIKLNNLYPSSIGHNTDNLLKELAKELADE